ncbi:MAG: hypothetical protein OXH92_09350 [Bryobacterales bacterium]|nr:hypothetical protein [Bryobacterales bacterium]MDE0434199.1 hypothetical protein [Bryobacterales bacterium]
MATITFDTREAVRNLTAAGFAEEQADAVVDTLAGAFSDTVATKADIAEVKAEIANLKTEIASVKAEMFRALWIQGAGLVGVQLAIAGLLYSLLR